MTKKQLSKVEERIIEFTSSGRETSVNEISKRVGCCFGTANRALQRLGIKLNRSAKSLGTQRGAKRREDKKPMDVSCLPEYIEAGEALYDDITADKVVTLLKGLLSGDVNRKDFDSAVSALTIRCRALSEQLACLHKVTA